MKIDDLEFNISKNISKISLLKGKELFINNKLIKISGKNINGIYNLYGKVKGDSRCLGYNPHIRIDLKSGKILLTKCECHNFNIDNPINEIFICEHLTCTMIKFFDQAKKQIRNKYKNEDVERKNGDNLNDQIDNYLENENENKELLDICVSLKEVKDKNYDYFEASFFIGNKVKHLINIKEFIESTIEEENFYIGKGLIYTNKTYCFNNEDENLIEFLQQYMSICKKELKGASIKILPENLRSFLSVINRKKIKFKYDYQSYLCDIVKNKLPVSFTMKKINNNYILTTKKIFPIPLNKRNDTYLYDRNIYIAPIEQIKFYNKLYKELKVNGEIKFDQNTNINKLNEFITILNSISNEVAIEQEIIDDLDELIELNFDFFEKNEKMMCDVKIITCNKEFKYKDETTLNNKILNKSKKISNIESEMNKYRFFYIDNIFVFYGTDDEHFEFLKSGINKLKTIGKVDNKKDKGEFKIHKGSSIKYYFNKNSKEQIEFSFSLDNLKSTDFNKVYNAWKEKRTYIKLDDGNFVNIDDEDIKKFLRIVENLNIDIMFGSKSYIIDESKLYYLNNKLNDHKYSVSGKNILEEGLSRLDNLENIDTSIPKKLKAKLRTYQTDGYIWLKNLSYLGLGGILADEMGLGKTIQIISFLLSEIKKTSLVITPTSLIYNWNDEFQKFAPNLKVGIVHGSSKERIKVINNIKKYDVVLTTYGTIRNDFLKYENICFDNLIIDEAQNINNPKAKVTESVKNIKSKVRFALTGTPIENNLFDLWSLFDFIMPGYLYTKDEFAKKFMIKDEVSKKDLKVLVNPYILRRVKKDVIKELPDKIENKFLVEMTSEQKKLYKIYVKDIQKKLLENDNRITIFSYITRLRQLCLDPSLVVDEYAGGSAKINVAKDLIKRGIQNNHKILLFSQFTSVLNKLTKELEDEKISYLYLDGSTPSKDRIKLVEEFNTQDINIFLISLKAGGTGLNLTSADMVIHFDPWWNPSIEEQATDRAHRIGQRNVVQVVKLITKESIEEKILLLQEDKKSLIEDIITGELKEDALLNKLNKEELINLLNL